MLTRLEIENFKGVGDRVVLDLRPITLLFGPNSAGKSTVLQALQYAREIFERRNLDPDQTVVGGKYVDLGGFNSFVHNHDLSRTVVLKLEVSIDDEQLEKFAVEFESTSKVLGLNIRAIAREPETVGVEIGISWSDLEECPYVSRYAVMIDGQHFATITAGPNLRSPLISELNFSHPILIRRNEYAQSPDELEPDNRSILELAMQACAEVVTPSTGKQIALFNQKDALPKFDRALLCDHAPFSPETDYGGMVLENEFNEHLGDQLNISGEMMQGLSDILVTPAVIIREELARLFYLGPMRETASRNHQSPRYPDPSRWASGLAAWDILHSDGDVVKNVNAWLTGPDSLQVNYQIQRNEFKEIPVDSSLMVLLRSGRAFDDLDDLRQLIDSYPTKANLSLIEENTGVVVYPQDIGIGISQLIPVVAISIDDQAKIVLIEQPELHVHPAIQVRLGDLFVKQIAENPKKIFILETHSEHLILRMLRRIRETTEDDLPPNHPGLRPSDLSVIYVDGKSSVPSTEVVEKKLRFKALRIDSSGEFVDDWPCGFFEERAEELFGL